METCWLPVDSSSRLGDLGFPHQKKVREDQTIRTHVDIACRFLSVG